MTALNIAIGTGRAVIVSDTLVTSTTDSTVKSYSSKCIAFAAQQLAVAGSGHLMMLDYATRLLMNGLPNGTTAADVAEKMSESLADFWRRMKGTKRTSICFVGAISLDEVGAFILRSPNFTSYRLARGVYVSPASEAPAEAQPIVDAEFEEPKEMERMPAEVAALPWHRLVQAAVGAVQLQYARFPASIGGQVIVTTITPFAIHQAAMGDLDAKSDA